MSIGASPGVKHPSLLDALVPLVALAVLIASALALFGFKIERIAPVLTEPTKETS